MITLLLLHACTTAEVSQAYEIDRLRILAVAAEPAEPRPGDTVSFSALVVSPVVPVALTTWFVCFLDGGADFGCAIDPAITEELAGLDPESLTPEELADLYAQLLEAGLIGVDPFLPPTWTVPDDALDGLTEAEKLEGRIATLTLTSIPEGESVDEDDLELAYKRVPVSLASTPNHNPVILGIRVDGVEVAPGSRLRLDRGQAYTLEVVVDEASIETYAYVNPDGVEEIRAEEPYYGWYLQEGSFDQTLTLDPFREVEYTTPVAPSLLEQSVWVVARDRRGGMAWAELHFELADPR